MVLALRGAQSISQGIGPSHHHHGHSDIILRRTVVIDPGFLPKGCMTYPYSTQVQPFYEPSTIYPVANPIGPEYAPQYGFGSNPVPGSISYQVDQTSQLSTNEVKFLKNSIQLADEQSSVFLYNLVGALHSPELANDNFVIEGHASAEGSTASNQRLSQQRANGIFDFMVEQGIAPSRLLAVGHGETYARYAATDPEYLRAEDRRVIIFKMVR